MKYDAVVFDLLTALIDSWSLWNSVAGSPEAGMVWRRRYLEITYGCGAYRPYETLVREAAHDVGMPERLGEELERRWQELTPWPEAAPVLKRVPVPLAVALQGEQEGARDEERDRVKQLLKQPIIVDLRNVYRPGDIRKRGFTYVSVGRPAVG